MPKQVMLNCPYLDELEKIELRKANDYPDIVPVALRILERMKFMKPKEKIIMICGPMWSGNRTKEENLRLFNQATKAFENAGYHIFKQMIFAQSMIRIQGIQGYTYPNIELLEEFYGKIFDKKLIDRLLFMPGSEHSYGAKWEHHQAEARPIDFIDLPDDFKEKLLLGERF